MSKVKDVLYELGAGQGWFIKRKHRHTATWAIAEINDLNHTIRMLEAEVSNRNKETESLRKLIKETEDTGSKWKEEYLKMNDKFTATQQKLDESYMNNQGLHYEKYELEQQIESCKKIMEDARKQDDRVRKGNQELTQANQKLKDEIAELQKTNKNFEDNYTSSYNEFVKTHKENDGLTVRLNELIKSEAEKCFQAVTAQGKLNDLLADVTVAVEHLKNTLTK